MKWPLGKDSHPSTEADYILPFLFQSIKAENHTVLCLDHVAGSGQDEFPTDTMFEEIAHCVFSQAGCQKEIKDTLANSAAVQ